MTPECTNGVISLLYCTIPDVTQRLRCTAWVQPRECGVGYLQHSLVQPWNKYNTHDVTICLPSVLRLNRCSVGVGFAQPAQPSSSAPDGPVSDVAFRQRLRSTSSHQLSVPRYRLSTIRSLGVFRCWPDCLELIAGRPSGSGVLCWQLQTVAEDIISIFAVLVCSAHLRFFYVNALYKFTFDIWHLKHDFRRLCI